MLLASWLTGWNQKQVTETLCTYSEDDGAHSDDVSTGGKQDAETAGTFCDVDSAARNLVRQRDPVSKHYRTLMLCHALGPGSPARQGAGHE
jgi:hypothetical protein